MVSKISKGVFISVETFYQAEYSNPVANEYTFAYRITIENKNDFTIKLLSRKWFIFDSSCDDKEVDGDGVVGVQPVLQRDQQFQYVSGCNLRSELGRMSGYYIMENLKDKSKFQVKIPPFDLMAPMKFN